MKKNINIDKKVYFSSMIGEVCAISLENDLKFNENNDVYGNLIVSGRYKATVASQVEEDFLEKIPVEITVTDKLDVETCKIDIVDFNYDIVDNSNLNCHIELSIEGDEIFEEERECDGDPVELKEKEIPKLEPVEKEISKIEKENIEVLDDVDRNEEVTNEIEVVEDDKNDENDKNLLFNIDSSETYGTFIVYMVRQHETINSILEKYNTTLDEIEKYNDIKNLDIGTKLIIPILNDKDK